MEGRKKKDRQTSTAKNLSKDLKITCETKFEGLSTVTLSSKGEFLHDLDDNNPYKLAITLKEMPGNYHVIATPEAENIELRSLKQGHLIWNIIPLRTSFELIFTVKVQEPFKKSLWSFPVIETCKIQEPCLFLKSMYSLFTKNASYVVPAIISLLTTIVPYG